MGAMHKNTWNIWNKAMVITYSSIYANKNMKLQKRNCWLICVDLCKRVSENWKFDDRRDDINSNKVR